jgi:hypothetical protein
VSGEMAKTWVLDTETKGTGANVVPLERREQRPEQREARPLALPRRPAPRPAPPPAPKAPHRFKVVDLVTREVLAQDTDARATVEALRDVGSVVDVHISVWEPKAERWRLLTMSEQQALWRFRQGASGR